MAAPMEPANPSATDLEQIFRENHALVFRAAYRVTGNAERRRRRAANRLSRMLKRDPGAEPVGNMASFLHRAAVNAALDLVRSRQNIRNIPLDELEPVLAEPAHRRPDRAQSSGEIREWLRGALARLNPAHRRNVHAPVLRRQGKPRDRAPAEHHAGNRGGDPLAHARPSGKGISSLHGRCGMTPRIQPRRFTCDRSRPGASRV